MGVLPFYGASEPELFAIERRAMDRPQRVVAALDAVLPDGLVLDIGAGSGHTAARLTTPSRTPVAVEPAAGMIDASVPMAWLRGDAEAMPFARDSFDGLYSTWAYFFSRNFDPGPGLREAWRVVRPGGVIAVVDNLGGDEFGALADTDIAADPAFWHRLGFELTAIETVFEFDTIEDARRLLGRFFGARGAAVDRVSFGFAVGLWTREVTVDGPPV
ncbi:MAG: class I SAM-dependent methyltransferase [Actinomycetota bacterium]